MKYSKTGILKKKVGPTSDVLQEEAKRMEEKLSELKDFMMKEKEKRENAPKMKDGRKWRSSDLNKPISGYADLVLSQKGKISAKPRPPKKEFIPTSSFLPPVQEEKLENVEKPVQDEVLSFLKSCGLEKYHEKFVENGVEELEILLEMNEGHLANVGLPLGHRLKLMKRIKECKEAQQKETQVKGKENLPEMKRVESEKPWKSEAGEPRTHEICIGNDDEIPAGEFNEAESFNLFKEAIENYRKAGSPTTHKLKSKPVEEPLKKVKFFEPVTEEMIPKNVKGLLYEGSWAPPESAVVETFEESSGTQVAVIINERKSCWNCYKIFEASDGVKEFDKEFCGKACAELFFNDRGTVCACGNRYLKNFERIKIEACSVACFEARKKDEKLGSGGEDRGLEDIGNRIDEGEGKGEGEGELTGEDDKIDEGEGESSSDEGMTGLLVFIDPTTGDPVLRTQDPIMK